MKTHSQVVVIGGGLIGCSILYHLTRLGWTDVMLLERSELTSGSTWHAAANIHGLHDNSNISRMQYYTMSLYAELEKETGQSCGIFQPGSLYLAQTREREHQLRLQAAKARLFGVDFHEVSLAEAKQLHPLIDLDGIRCVMFEPEGGNVDPSGVTHAYAAGARARGASIHRFTPVLETNQRRDGGWDVVTAEATVHAEHVVNAAGLWGREVSALAGLTLPLMTLEHQYFVTESIPEIAALDHRLPSVADRDGEYYLRQEGQGLLVGAYERDGRFWAVDGTPLDFGHELLPDDLERIEENTARACERLPVLGEAGIKRVINGPMIWSPDSSALFGPVPELSNYWSCNGIIPGYSQSGGLGMQLAQWIVEGEPELDLFAWDIARYGDWTPKSFVAARALDAYTHRFKIHFPYEEREAGRPVRTRPVYAKQQALGAVFGMNYGWEHPLWFGGPGTSPTEEYGYERQAWLTPVGKECKALREGVGVIDISNFAKYRITGTGAGDWLDRLVANRVPRETGRTCLAPMLGKRGGIAGDFTITCLGDDDYWMIGSGMAERYHKRFFDAIKRPQSVLFESMTVNWCGFNVAGPKARELLEQLTDVDLSNAAWPFMRSRRLVVAGIEAIGLRVSFTGDLGWELYVPESAQLALYKAILATDNSFRVVPVGSRALLSMRIEKGYGSWGREYSPEYWPQETGLHRLIKDDKPEFLGRSAWLELKSRKPRYTMVTLLIEAHENPDMPCADASGGEPVFLPDGTPVGYVTSGAWSFTTNASLALGYIKTEALDARHEAFDVAVLGLPHRARLLEAPPFDPTGERLRG